MPTDYANNDSPSTTDNFLDRLTNAAFDIGVPLARNALGGSAEQDAIVEREKWNRVNGSGAVDGKGSLRAPASLFDFAFGQGNGSGTPSTVPAGPFQGGGNVVLIGLVVIVLVVVLVMGRR